MNNLGTLCWDDRTQSWADPWTPHRIHSQDGVWGLRLWICLVHCGDTKAKWNSFESRIRLSVVWCGVWDPWVPQSSRQSPAARVLFRYTNQAYQAMCSGVTLLCSNDVHRTDLSVSPSFFPFSSLQLTTDSHSPHTGRTGSQVCAIILHRSPRYSTVWPNARENAMVSEHRAVTGLRAHRPFLGRSSWGSTVLSKHSCIAFAENTTCRLAITTGFRAPL